MRKYDLSGRRFGKIVVLGLSKIVKHRVFLWECKCDCGNSIYVRTQNLINENRQSCGCTKPINLIGLKVDRLEVVEYKGTDKNQQKLWLCKCSCGNTTIQPTAVLTKKKVRSCGCLHCRTGEENPQYRGYKGISAVLWRQIKSCATKRYLEFNIDQEYIWNLFISQDKKCKLSGLSLNLSTERQHSLITGSLDRIDSSKGYIKGNVQWVHKDVNKMKSNLDEKYFINICKSIANTIT